MLRCWLRHWCIPGRHYRQSLWLRGWLAALHVYEHRFITALDERGVIRVALQGRKWYAPHGAILVFPIAVLTRPALHVRSPVVLACALTGR